MSIAIVLPVSISAPCSARTSSGGDVGAIVTLAPTTRRVLAEYLGTMILVTAVVGSGIMATNLTDDVGVQLLMNMLATVMVLGLLIWTLGPISGAHFNPAVTGVALARREIAGREGAAYILAQVSAPSRERCWPT